MNTLIASLGKTPAVITETLDYLMPKYRHPEAQQNIVEIDRLVLIFPAKQEFINDSTIILLEEWTKTFKKSKDNFHISSDPQLGTYPLDYKDILTTDAVKAFSKAVFDLTMKFSSSSDRVYYSITGGRKSMAAVMAYLAQICNVHSIFHIIADDDYNKYRESESFYEHANDREDLIKLLYPDPENIKPMRMLAGRFFDQKTVSRVHHFLAKNGKPTDLTENEQLLYDFLKIGKEKFELPENMNLSIDDRIKDSVASLKKANLSSKQVDLASKIISKFVKNVNCVHHLKYHKQKERRWKLSWYEFMFFEQTKVLDIEGFLPMADNLSLSFHIATKANSSDQLMVNWREIQTFFKNEFPKKFKGDIPQNGENVLITSLGKSPGVVTEAVEYFEKKSGLVFDKIVIIAPDNQIIRDIGVDDILKKYYKDKLEAHYVPEIKDVETDADVEKFIKKASEVIHEYKEKGYNIFLNFAGGRKTMSAAMVRLAQIGNIEQAFHVLITDPKLEQWCTEEGSITKLIERRDEDIQGGQRDDGTRWDEPMFPDLNKFDVIYFPVGNRQISA